MFAFNRIVALTLLLLLGGLVSLSGCGSDDGLGETLHIYVVNAYPGSSKLTLYGPTGKLASGLAFGERTAEAVKLDRNVNSEQFTLMIDGAPTQFQLSEETFSLFPQETATMVIVRRSGESTAAAMLFRHTRMFSPKCVTTFGNALSLNNRYLSDELLSYSFQTEWKHSPEEMKEYYDEDAEKITRTRCGFTETPANARNTRKGLIYDHNKRDPWLVPVTAPDGNGYTLAWGVRSLVPTGNGNEAELMSLGIHKDGNWVYRNTESYLKCLESAVAVKQEEDAGGAAGNPDEAEACPVPNGPMYNTPDGQVALLGADQVEWDDLAIHDCLKEVRETGFPVVPSEGQNGHSFEEWPRKVDGEWVCGYPTRFRTPTMDIIFQNINSDTLNYVEGRGGFVEIDNIYPMRDERFVVLFGRPVNPFVIQWSAGDTFVLDGDKEFPYPGGIEPGYKQE